MGVSRGAARVAAIVAAIGFVLLASFQAALALGAPWGEAAWGGEHAVLPASLRLGSAVSSLVFIGAALVVLGRAGIWRHRGPAALFRWGTWALAALTLLSALANLASTSRWERLLLAPLALLLALLCLLVALGSRAPSAE